MTPTSTLAERVAALTWYHTFDLPGGVTTKGFYDHRRMVHRLPIPASLDGLRCLDVAASDGFWSFELARRGAAEVVSVDLPVITDQDYGGPSSPQDIERRAAWSGRANQAFAIVKEQLGLDVERVDGSVYDLPTLGIGRFDYVFMGNILLHLRDPLRALEQVRRVLEPAGEFLSFEPISLPQTLLRPFTPTGQFSANEENRFWTPNLKAHRRMIALAGFEVLAAGGPLLQRLGAQWPRWPSRAPRSLHELTFWSCTRQFGTSSAWVRARGVPT
jgi:tRNA (mo5U34)-methyltransferase